MGLINYVGSLFNDKPYDGFRPVSDMNALERFGHFYDSSMNPNYMDNYSRREENYYKDKQEEQAKVQNAEALKSLSTLAAKQFGLPEDEVLSVASQLSPDQALRALTLIQPPSDARMWKQYSGMTPEEQRQFNAMKRQQQVIDLGDRKTVIDPTNPQNALASYPQGIAPQTKITDEQIITTPAISGEQLQPSVPQLPMSALQQLDAQTPANAPAPTPSMNPMLNVQDIPLSETKRKKLEGEITPVQKRKDAQSRVSGNLLSLAKNYQELYDMGGIADVDKSGVENIMARIGSSDIGQGIGTALGTKTQEIRNKINMIRPTLVNDIRQASEMGSRGMDTEKELEFFLQAATDPTRTIGANMAAIKALDDAYGLGSGVEASPDEISKLREEFNSLVSNKEDGNKSYNGWSIKRID